jgi:hypothetical protein
MPSKTEYSATERAVLWTVPVETRASARRRPQIPPRASRSVTPSPRASKRPAGR